MHTQHESASTPTEPVYTSNSRAVRSRQKRPFAQLLAGITAALTLGAGAVLVQSGASASTSLSGVANTYQDVASISGSTVTVSGSLAGAGQAFAIGDRVVLMNMASGRYSTTTVTAVSGNDITLASIGLVTWSTTTQLIKMPWSTAGIIASSVTALPWDGNVGGVVALGGSELQGSVSATGAGQTNGAVITSVNGPAGTGQGAVSGRGLSSGTSEGGGGIGGGPGVTTNAGSAVSNGEDGSIEVGADSFGGGGGAGGGGGITGGGGGGGGLFAGGGGGGVAGGGAGGDGSLANANGGGGGHVGGVGAGGNGQPGTSTAGLQPPNCYVPAGAGIEGGAGGGGGSYGGGGGASASYAGGDDGSGGGGGGAWAGGGAGGVPGTGTNAGGAYLAGGAGNVPVATPIPDAAHFLHPGNARLFMGAPGGTGSSDSGSLTGGRGGGIVILDFQTIAGATISADGQTGQTPTGSHGGSGGGGGGQMHVRAGTFSSASTISVRGGSGGLGGIGACHGGAAGGGGGGGGVLLESVGVTQSTNNLPSVPNVTFLLAGASASNSVTNPKNSLSTSTGGGGGFGIGSIRELTTYDLALVQTLTNTPTRGGTADYTIRVKNQGSSASGNYSVTFTLPAGTTYSTSSDGGTNSGSTITWNLSGLAAGATKDITLTLDVDVAATAGSHTGWAEISGDSGDDTDSTADTNTGNDATVPNDLVTDRTALTDVDTDLAIGVDEDDNDPASFTLGAVPVYDLALVQTLTNSPTRGGSANYTIRVKNQGNGPSGSFTVTDTLPTGLTFTSASDSGTAASGVITWTVADLAAGATKDLTFIAAVPADATEATYKNWAEISADSGNDADSTPDTNTGNGATVPNDLVTDRTALTDVDTDLAVGTDEDDNDLAEFALSAIPKIDLALAKTVTSSGPYTAGSTVTYSLVARNIGPMPTSGEFGITDRLPAGLSFAATAAQGTSWFCNAPVGQDVTCAYTGPALAAGQSAPALTVNAVIGSGVQGSLVNLAKVTPCGCELPEVTPLGTDNQGFETGDPLVGSNNDASATITADGRIDLSLAMTLLTTGTPTTGGEVQFGLVARNNGPSATTQPFTVVNKLPAGLTYATTNPGSGDQWTCATPVGQEMTCTYNGPSLAVGASAPQLTIRSVVAAGTSGSLVNIAKVVPGSNERVETNLLGTANSGYETGDPAVGSNNDASSLVTVALPATTTTVAPVTTVVVVQPTTTTTIPGTATTVPGAVTTIPPGTPTTQPSGTPTTFVPMATVPPVAPTQPVTPSPRPTGSIGDCVWVDRNLNGVADPDERGIPGAVVTLTLSDGTTRTTTAAADCFYSFDGLQPGVYQVEIMATSTPTNGSRVKTVTLAEGQVYADADFGFSTTGVKGVQVQAENPLALTGARSLLMSALALMVLGFGGLLATARRRRRI